MVSKVLYDTRSRVCEVIQVRVSTEAGARAFEDELSSHNLNGYDQFVAPP